MQIIRILIVDDEINWIKTIELFLSKENDIKVVATATNKDDALEIVRQKEIDVVLMDINLTENNLDGIYAATEIFEISDTKIIMLTSLDPKEVSSDSFNAGAIDFISKADYKNIPEVIRKAYKGNIAMEELLKDYRKAKEEIAVRELTPSEIEVLNLLKKGFKRKKISEVLFKSESTIKNQISKILTKLRVKNSKEAVEKVKYRGIRKSVDE